MIAVVGKSHTQYADFISHICVSQVDNYKFVNSPRRVRGIKYTSYILLSSSREIADFELKGILYVLDLIISRNNQ